MRLRSLLFAFVCIVLIPSVVSAQASITGFVRDSSGAVLPGVTVEAASPALIEKVRTAVTDGTGQYRIVDLRPGTYSVTFTLPGFSVVRRDGVELTGSFTASIDAELRVGAVEETDHRGRRDADRRRAERAPRGDGLERSADGYSRPRDRGPRRRC